PVPDPAEDTEEQDQETDSSEEIEEDDEITEEERAQNTIKLNAKTSVKWSGSSIAVKWGAVKEADGYDIFASKAGASDDMLATTITNGKKTSVKLSKLAGKKLDTGSVYRFCVRAYHIVNGDKQYIAIGQKLYLAGSKHKQYTNVKSIRVNQSTIQLGKGKQIQIKATVVKQKSSKKLLPAKYGKSLRYTSTNETIATVTAKGRIKAKKKGSCYIYVTALNGVNRRIKVTVK
ncbi:MAG: Ig-like domain-containing protein, partial [Lachnospiraceae bacterium]|nr:Ig-like domain-containing protein [Lachnospiraceae bacterium]